MSRVVLDHCEEIPVGSLARAEAVRDQWQFGLELKRRALRRLHPSITESELNARIFEWLQSDE